jgi:two-component system OmpR family response regulator
MSRQILIVEDNRMLLELMKSKLEGQGYHVKKAENGLEALNVVEKNKIDLIISDIMMPNISGLSLLGVLNDSPNRIPVILMSSNEQKNVIDSAKKLGASDYIIKPINFEELCKKISLLLQMKSQTEKKASSHHKK